MSAFDDATEALELISAIRPLLRGRTPEVQGAVLADLLAMWLAGHVVRGDQEATHRCRNVVLKEHIKGVRNLIDPNYKMSVEPQLKAKTQ